MSSFPIYAMGRNDSGQLGRPRIHGNFSSLPTPLTRHNCMERAATAPCHCPMNRRDEERSYTTYETNDADGLTCQCRTNPLAPPPSLLNAAVEPPSVIGGINAIKAASAHPADPPAASQRAVGDDSTPDWDSLSAGAAGAGAGFTVVYCAAGLETYVCG